MGKPLLQALLALTILSSANPVCARVVYQAPENSGTQYQSFFQNVESQLQLMKAARDSNMQAFYSYIMQAPGVIFIQPVTDDSATWMGRDPANRNRSHVRWIPSQSRPGARDAILYMVPKYVEPSDKAFNYGTLPHEMVHATDYVYGHYHQERQYRERRGVFVENIWRDMVSHPLRTNYHNQFDTLDYQEAKTKGQVAWVLGNYIFKRNDLP